MSKTKGEDEEALIARANEEREKLFQRYDRGREQEDIDPWEDPGFEVYHQTDRYGFIHDKRLPQKENPNEQKAKAIELERVKKWLKMLNKWSTKETKEKLRSRVYKGIPDKLRSKVWVKLLNLEEVMAGKEDVYKNMLRLARQWGTEARQIDSDVNRQFREHLFYRERYSIKQKSLFNVLTAYSMYNSEVGYCQGMSGLAGVLLMYMDEEEAFWALSTLLADKKYAMHGLYIEGFPKLTRFLAHHDKIITKFLPKLKKHFDQFNLDSILYSLKWFFVIFVERIPFSLCLRVWDIYMLDGEKVVTAFAYTILRLHKSRILKLRDMDAIVQYIQAQLHRDFGFDEDYAIKALEQSSEELKRAKLELPPDPGEIEFPKRPFGVFNEPSFESKIGRRKSIFTEKEREVTDTVILRRELTATDIATEINNNENTKLSEMGAVGIGSNGHLNSVHGVAESEDGGSLLGSSRKSLADTSVTSTADLSIFSGGQRSQNAYDEDGHTINNSIHSNNAIQDEEDFDGHMAASVASQDILEEEDEEQSSPGSAYCSLSIVGRTPSQIRITPTPRAVSPQDIVRIYVPAAPPDEVQSITSSNGRGGDMMAKSPSSSADSRITVTATNLPGSVQMPITPTSDNTTSYKQPSNMRTGTGSSGGGRQRPSRRHSGSSNKDEESAGLVRTLRDLGLLTNSNNSLSQIPNSTSSSRRGSMSRKSPLVDADIIVECSHMKRSDLRQGSLSHRQSFGELERDHFANNGMMVRKDDRIMTSFERLAQKSDAFYLSSPTQRLKEPQQQQAWSHGGEERVTPERSGSSNRDIRAAKTGNTSDEETFALTFQERMRLEENMNQFPSDYTMQYKSESSDGGRTPQNAQYKELSAEELKEIKKNKKQYDRFFTPDEDEDDDDDVMLGVGGKNADGELGKKGSRRPQIYHLHHRKIPIKKPPNQVKKSSDDSSSSPPSFGSINSKSTLTTPVNETQPLIMPSGSISPNNGAFQFRHNLKKRPKNVDRMDEDEEGYDDEEDEEFDRDRITPISSPTSSAAYFKVDKSTSGGRYIPIMDTSSHAFIQEIGHHYHSPISPTGNAQDMRNKIRIKVNEKK